MAALRARMLLHLPARMVGRVDEMCYGVVRQAFSKRALLFFTLIDLRYPIGPSDTGSELPNVLIEMRNYHYDQR